MQSYAPSSSVMPFEGTTKTSRTALALSQVSDEYTYTVTIYDQLFLIFDELTRLSQPSSVFVFIQFFISFYQYFITSYLPFLPEVWDFLQFPDKILRYLTYPIDFGLGDANILDTGGSTYFLLVLSALIIIYLIIILLFFHFNKMFPHNHTIITRFIISYLIPIILSPICYNIGFSFNSIFSNEVQISIDSNLIQTNQTVVIDINDNMFETRVNRKPLFIASTVLGIVFYLVLLCFFYIDLMFRSSTPYLENTLLSSWDGMPVFLIIFGTSMTILFSRMIFRLPKWTYYLLNVCCIAYNCFVLYKVFCFPMIKRRMNVVLSVFICSSVISSLFQLFPIPSLYRIVIPFCLLAVEIPVFIFVFRFIRKKAFSTEFDDVNLSNENRAIKYLRLCISNKCTEFISFKWIKPINQIGTTRLFCQAAQMMSFFPSESQNLTFYISLLSKRNDLLLHQRFLFVQLRRVHILRQSNTSRQLNEDIENISKSTNQAISYFQQFLIRIIDERQELTIDRLNFLSKINHSTNSLCHEAISRYPNNSRLLFIFSQYVIECQADFKRGISLFQEGQMIDRGKHGFIDYAFKSMVNLFPVYLYKRILDAKGNKILNRKRSKSGSSISIDSISNERYVSDTDIDSNDKLASCVIDNPRLRLSLKKAVSQMNSTGVTILTISSIIRFIFSIVICIVIYGFSVNFLDDRSINYKNIATIGKVRKNIDMAFFRMAKLWVSNLEISPTQKRINESLGPHVTLDEYHNFTRGPKFSLFQDALESIKSIEELGKLLIEITYESSMMINDKSTSDFVQMNNISFCNLKRKKIVQSTTSVRYFSLYLLYQAIQASNLGNVYDNPVDWKNDERICEIILNNYNVVKILTDQSTILVNQERELSTAVEKQIILFFSISIPIVFCVYIIPFIGGYIKMNLEFQQIFDVLKLLPIEIYKKASQPIAIFQTENEASQQMTITQAEQTSCQKATIIIPSIIGTIIVTGVLIAIFLLIKDSNSKFYSIVKWLEIGSGRSPLLIETVTNAVYSNIFGYLGDTDYTSLLYHLELVHNYSQELLYQHKTLIWGSDDSTSCNNFSKRLDSLHFVNTCRINEGSDYFSKNYQCLSVDQQVMTFNKFAKDFYLTLLYAINSNNSTENSTYNEILSVILNGYELTNLHFLGITYLLPRLEAAQDILDEAINLKISQLRDYSLLIAVLYLVSAIVLFFINIASIKNLKDDYNIVRILISRLPPLLVARNQSLVELITGSLDRKNDKKLTPIMIHIRYCSNPIIAFNKDLKIQLINLSTTKLFGFTKEQLFQADLSSIIDQEEYLIIKQKVQKNNEHKENKKSNSREKNNKNNEDSFDELDYNGDSRIDQLSRLLNNDDEIDLNNNNNNSDPNEKVDLFNDPYKFIVIGIKDNGSQIILSSVLTYCIEPDDCYVLILNDVTNIYVNENDIEKAKQDTLNLMNEVLPRAMTQNGALEENVSFSIKNVSVINIKILNFNDLIPHITSVQAIRNMSVLFTHFDMQLINYPNLTKISVLSDSYQAVGGLFDSSSIRILTPQNSERKEMSRNHSQGELSSGNTENKTNANTGSKAIKNTRSILIIDDKNQSDNSGTITNNNENKNENRESNNNDVQNPSNNNDNESNDNVNSTNNESNNNADSTNNESNNNADSTNNENNNNADSNNINTNNDNDNDKENNNNSDNSPNESNFNKDTNVDGNNSNINSNNENGNDKDSNVDNSNKNNESNKGKTNNDNNNEICCLGDDNNTIIVSGRNKEQISHVGSRKSIYNIRSLNPSKHINFSNVVLDSIYFAFNCLSAVEFFNSSNGTNLVLGIGINVGGPVTAGTIGKEHMHFDVVGGAIKESFLVCNSAEEGNIVITKEAYECIKNTDDAKSNIVFEKYKQVNLLHSRITETYLARPSESLYSSAQYDDVNRDENDNENNAAGVVDADGECDEDVGAEEVDLDLRDQNEQMVNPDDLLS